MVTRLGEGGMGVVHLGQAADGRRLAVKVLRPHVVGDDEARAVAFGQNPHRPIGDARHRRENRPIA